MRVAVGAGHHQPVQHGQIDGPLDIEAELPFAQQAAQHIATAGLLPQPSEHQVGADADPPQFGQFTAIEAGQHDRAAGMAGGRGDQAIEQVGVLDLIAAAERLDDALDVTAALASVLDEVEVFVGSDLLDADEHGVEPDCPQATTSNRRTSRFIPCYQRIDRTGLAPQFDRHVANPRNTAGFMPPKAQRWESWVMAFVILECIGFVISIRCDSAKSR